MKTILIRITENPEKPFVFDKPGAYVAFIHNASGKFIFELKGSDVYLDIYGLFTGKGADSFNIETVQLHAAPRSTSNLFIKGVFKDKSRFNYQGLIRIEKDGQQSHAYQKNQNLILSPDTYVESKPFLEILANDVFCTHGSTTGKLNAEQLFYVKSRGLSDDEAKDLLVEGFVEEIVDKVKEKVPDFRITE
jgi:Fe-S cluster assembly protein SufD